MFEIKGRQTAAESTSLPLDIYYYFELTPTDHSGVLLVVLTINLTYSILTSAARFYIRRGWGSHDDWIIALATVLQT